VMLVSRRAGVAGSWGGRGVFGSSWVGLLGHRTHLGLRVHVFVPVFDRRAQRFELPGRRLALADGMGQQGATEATVVCHNLTVGWVLHLESTLGSARATTRLLNKLFLSLPCPAKQTQHQTIQSAPEVSYILRSTRPRVNTARRIRRAYVVFALYLRVRRSCKL
jgi:hypothetical protein